jgi:hypothetical protein
MKMITVKSLLFEEILLPNEATSLRIEVAASDVIDCGVMDNDSYNLFVVADSDRNIKKAKWFEQIKSKTFTFQPEGNYYWLILSNVYSSKAVSVAYSITEEDSNE